MYRKIPNNEPNTYLLVLKNNTNITNLENKYDEIAKLRGYEILYGNINNIQETLRFIDRKKQLIVDIYDVYDDTLTYKANSLIDFNIKEIYFMNCIYDTPLNKNYINYSLKCIYNQYIHKELYKIIKECNNKILIYKNWTTIPLTKNTLIYRWGFKGFLGRMFSKDEVLTFT